MVDMVAKEQVNSEAGQESEGVVIEEERCS